MCTHQKKKILGKILTRNVQNISEEEFKILQKNIKGNMNNEKAHTAFENQRLVFLVCHNVQYAFSKIPTRILLNHQIVKLMCKLLCENSTLLKKHLILLCLNLL